ncbi:hypothetical protein Leryth_027205 [Lithospermum erythrorhizon]|nr:hypothetical protein Leryth_027205 [Lithospermum erythrorhizon]
MNTWSITLLHDSLMLGPGTLVLCGWLNFLHVQTSSKALLKALNRDEFGSIFEKAKEANVAFKEAVQAHMDDPLNVTLKLKCHESRSKALSLSYTELSFITVNHTANVTARFEVYLRHQYLRYCSPNRQSVCSPAAVIR